ncbi:fumarate reductase (quinol) flavoprotein subunit, partial [Klebsiella pneumoniae]
MQTFQADLAVIGAGGAGLRAAIAAAQANPNAKIALISKVYPMRSHTVAAEGGSAAVAQDHDSFEYHFHDTVAGGDWLCEQDVVDYFVHHCPTEMTQLEQWGCPWSRRPDGSVNVRRFGGMKIERTWFAADKTGFHMLHTLFQTSLQFPQIQRFDEHFVLDLLVDDGQARGLVAMNMMEGTLVQIRANAVVLATGGAGRVYRYNTNGGIVTGDGMGMALGHGVPLRDMEFVQYHPTGLPGSGILMTEGCRGEGGILVNKNGYRYLQDYGMGPETPLGEPKNKYMELGPRDKVSQAFWHEWRKGNTIPTPRGDVVYLDLRHLGEKKLLERLPFICELAKAYVGVDPVKEPIPVIPTCHYMMGGIPTKVTGQALTVNEKGEDVVIPGLFAVGEIACVSVHGANRLGGNSLLDLVVFGRAAGLHLQESIAEQGTLRDASESDIEGSLDRLNRWNNTRSGEDPVAIRKALQECMQHNFSVFREGDAMHKGLEQLKVIRERLKNARLDDTSSEFNTQRVECLELDNLMETAYATAVSANFRTES